MNQSFSFVNFLLLQSVDPLLTQAFFNVKKKRAEPAYFANISSARLRSFSLETRCASTCKVFVSMSVMEP